MLQAFDLTAENITAAQKQRFYRICAKYVLTYQCNTRKTLNNVVSEDELHYLSDADRRWLHDCNMAIIAEETEKHRDEMAARMGLMVDRLEQALEDERVKENAEQHDRTATE